MKKSVLIIAMAITMIACNKETEVKEVKTAYIDTVKLMEEYTEAKDVNEKFKTESEMAGRKLEVAEANFKADAEYFQRNAQANGQAWAQQKGAELQRREQQLQYEAQTMARNIQMKHGAEMDSVVKGVKKFIKDYGKEKGYAYIYGTGDASTVLYAEDKYDITSEIVKLLNDKYKAPAAKPATEEKK